MLDCKTPGIVDIETREDESFYGVISSIDATKLICNSNEKPNEKSKVSIHFSLPVLDWIFQANATVESCRTSSLESQEKLPYEICLSFELETREDQAKLDTFFLMHQEGKTEIKGLVI